MKTYLSAEVTGPKKWAVTINHTKALVRKQGRQWEVMIYGGRFCDIGNYSESYKKRFITVAKLCA